MPKELHVIARIAVRPLSLAIGLGFTNGVLAEANPYYIGVSQAFTHDSNVFRRPDNGTLPVVADTVSSTGLLGGIDQPFGRQRFFANGTAAVNRHKNLDQLDNTSYGLATGLDWSTIERLSGNVRLSANQSLANYGDVNAATTTEKNLQKSRQFSANARYGLAASLGLEGGVEHGSVDFSAPNDLRTVRQDSANLGLRWGGGGPLSVGVSARTSKAKYPAVATGVGTTAPDELKRNDVGVNATYTPTGLSTFSGHLNATREDHSLDNQSDFHGMTGGVAWDYHLSGKLNLTATLNRDTGTATTFMQLVQSPLPTTPLTPPTVTTVRVDANRVSTTAQLGFNYELTAKIQFNGDVSHIGSSTGDTSSDALTRYNIGAKYQPTRTISLGCNAGRESRSGVYSAHTVGCNAELAFR
jgi:hypothetical protein